MAKAKIARSRRATKREAAKPVDAEIRRAAERAGIIPREVGTFDRGDLDRLDDTLRRAIIHVLDAATPCDVPRRVGRAEHALLAREAIESVRRDLRELGGAL